MDQSAPQTCGHRSVCVCVCRLVSWCWLAGQRAQSSETNQNNNNNMALFRATRSSANQFSLGFGCERTNGRKPEQQQEKTHLSFALMVRTICIKLRPASCVIDLLCDSLMIAGLCERARFQRPQRMSYSSWASCS